MDLRISHLLATVLCVTNAASAGFPVNGDFDVDLANWTVSGSCQPFFDEVLGSPQRGSLGLNCLPVTATRSVVTQCVTLAAPTAIDFSVRWSSNTSLPGANTGRFGFFAFAGNNCEGESLGFFPTVMSAIVPGFACCGSEWREESVTNQALPPTSGSVLVLLSAGAGDVLVFDHVVLERSVLFSNSFEGVSP